GLWGGYQWLDRAPKGRNEPTYWWRHHDKYGQPYHSSPRAPGEGTAAGGRGMGQRAGPCSSRPTTMWTKARPSLNRSGSSSTNNLQFRMSLVVSYNTTVFGVGHWHHVLHSGIYQWHLDSKETSLYWGHTC